MSTTFWLKALQLILALGLLVMVHEFGHYFFSRVFGVWVEKFYLFFNPWFSLAKWKPKAKLDKDGNEIKQSWRATTYGIGWVPLGGYCKIAGMIDESMDTEQMKQPAKPYEFRSKPAWQRLLIMVGGVLFNFLLAIVIYSGIVYSYGEMKINFTDATEGMDFSTSCHKAGLKDGDILLMADDHNLTAVNSDEIMVVLNAKTLKVLRNGNDTVSITLPSNFFAQVNGDAEKGELPMSLRFPVVISQTQPNMAAEKAGLKQGDRIVAVNNDTTPTFSELTPTLLKYANKVACVKYLRDGELKEVNVQVDENGKLGILLSEPTKIFKVTTIEYGLFQSIPRGIEMGWTKLVTYVKSLKILFQADGAQKLGGFGTIGSIFPATWNWLSFWEITAFLSVILAVMNILPIPALDGGHVLFLLYEMITRRQPSEKFLERAQTVGMFLLLALLLFANGNDIYRFIFK